MPELKSDEWTDTTPVQIQIKTRRRYNSRSLTGHICSDGQACSDYSIGSYNLVMPARAFVEWSDGCNKCQQAVAQMLDSDDEYGSLKEELYSPGGRPASQILIDEGFVPCAVNAFKTKEALLVAGLAECSLGKVLEEMSSDEDGNFKGRWTKYSIRCPNCLEQTSSNCLGRWPYIKRFQLDCQNCPAVTDINLYEYYPGSEWATDSLEERNFKRSRGVDHYQLVWHDIDLTDAIADKTEDEKFAEQDVYVNATSEQVTVHQVEDGEVQCGVNGGEVVTIYSHQKNDCGNCQ